MYSCAAGWAIADAADWYGLPTPKVTEPSLPTSGVSQAPPEPILLACTPASAPVRVLNLHAGRPFDALSANSTPPPGPVP